MFADDTKIWITISGINDAAARQKDLDSLSTWSAEWQLKFNPDKCKSHAHWTPIQNELYNTTRQY